MLISICDTNSTCAPWYNVEYLTSLKPMILPLPANSLTDQTQAHL